MLINNCSIVENHSTYEIYINQNGESHFVNVYAGNTPLSLIALEIEEAKLKLKQNEVQ